jgi:hypothetical protein
MILGNLWIVREKCPGWLKYANLKFCWEIAFYDVK